MVSSRRFPNERRQEANIYARASGYVLKRYVDIGDHVKTTRAPPPGQERGSRDVPRQSEFSVPARG